MKIAVIGNAAGGKTTLSRKLAEKHSAPLLHIDSIQFLPGMKIRPLDETRAALKEFSAQTKWIIDGYGPLDLLEARLRMADQIIFIDLPITLHYWWFLKRQIKSIWFPRGELPEGCNEVNFAHTLKVLKTIWRVHQQMRPELIRILARDQFKNKTITVKDVKYLNALQKS